MGHERKPLQLLTIWIVATLSLGASTEQCSWEFEGSGDYTKLEDETKCLSASGGLVDCPDAGGLAAGGGGATAPDAGTTNITIQLSPSKPIVGDNGQIQFTAKVTGTQDQAVIWYASQKEITQTGLYRAPTGLNGETTHTVTARSVADPDVSAEVVVTVLPYELRVAPASAQLHPGDTLTFSAQVDGLASENQGVFWSVPGGNGSINATTGVFTAGSTLGTATVRATSLYRPGYSVIIPVTITNAPLIDVTVLPAKATLTASGAMVGDGLQFVAEVENGVTGKVGWEIIPGSATDSSINPEGMFTAGATAGTLVVRGVSTEDPSKYSESEVTVVSPTSPTTKPRLAGTVTYTGTKTGRIYIEASVRCVGSTSILPNAPDVVSPLPFVLRPWKCAGTDPLKLRAWMDTLGVGQYVKGASPSGTIETASVPNGTLTITLTDPIPVDPGIISTTLPVIDKVVPTNAGALVFFRGVRNEDGELARRYKVVAYESVETTPAATVYIRAGTRPVAHLTGLSPGNQYSFVVRGVFNDAETIGASSAVVTLTNLQNSTTTHSLRSQVSYSQVFSGTATGTTGDLVLLGTSDLFATAKRRYWAGTVAASTGSSAVIVTIPNAQQGWFRANALLDVDGNGEFGPTDPVTFEASADSEFAPGSVKELTAGVSTLDFETISLSAEPSLGRVDLRTIGASTTLAFHVRSGRQLVRRVTLARAPAAVTGLELPVDLRLDSTTGTYVYDWPATGVALPAVAAEFGLDVLLDRQAGGFETRNLTVVVPAVVNPPVNVRFSSSNLDYTTQAVCDPCQSGNTGTMTPVYDTGVPATAKDYRIKIVGGGGPGTATFQWKLDEEGQVYSSGTPFVVNNTVVFTPFRLTNVTGDFVVNAEFRFRTTLYQQVTPPPTVLWDPPASGTSPSVYRIQFRSLSSTSAFQFLRGSAVGQFDWQSSGWPTLAGDYEVQVEGLAAAGRGVGETKFTTR